MCLDHPHLADLAGKLRSIIIFDRAPSTVYKYVKSFKRWLNWAESFGFCALPASGYSVALYLSELVGKSSSPAPVLSAVYGISWAHRKASAPNPCEHHLVTQVCEASKRLLGRQPVKKENLKATHVQSIMDKFGYFGASLPDLQVAVLIAVGFAGFLRWNDLQGIRLEDIHFSGSHMDITLRKRKNDQHCRGCVVTIARTSSSYCPVSLTERFMARSNISKGPLFRETKDCKHGGALSSTELHYSSARYQVLNAFNAIGLDERRFGLHSLRSGGASAASEAGISERLISIHGGWKSESSRNGYIRDSKQTLASVSKALGL